MGSRSWLEPYKAPASCQDLRVSAPLPGGELVPSSSRLVHEAGLVASQPMDSARAQGFAMGLFPEKTLACPET